MLDHSRKGSTPTIDLLLAARSSRLPFEASPTGRWVRFDGGEASIYVIRDAWGDGCVLMVATGDGNAQLEHFLRPQDAVAAAAQLARARLDDSLPLPPLRVAG